MAHHHSSNNYNRAFAIGVFLNIAFVIIEATYGFRADSLALVTDAGHNLSDVLGLLLAWGAAVLATFKPTPRRTFGFRRVTILASLISALLLLVALGAIFWEAIGRLNAPRPVDSATIIVVAGIGVVINSLTAMLFFSGQKLDLNIRGAFLHMAADAAISLGVVCAGLAILATGILWLDPLLSILITVIILFGTLSLLRDSVNLAIDAVPRAIDPEKVRKYFLELPEVVGLHDLHIWAMSTTEVALTVHLVIPNPQVEDSFLQKVSHDLHHKFGIEHLTLQIERTEGKFCLLANHSCH
jgi:cobalt-zinc-cadmium efflux system protein